MGKRREKGIIIDYQALMKISNLFFPRSESSFFTSRKKEQFSQLFGIKRTGEKSLK